MKNGTSSHCVITYEVSTAACSFYEAGSSKLSVKVIVQKGKTLL
jgi:hypothetical protein